MHIALISPLPPEQSGIADYAETFRLALEADGVTVSTPFRGCSLAREASQLQRQMASQDWSRFDLVHAELGGGRCGEFLALEWLARHHPRLPLTATVHDPERLIWRSARLPAWLNRLPRRLGQAIVLLSNPLALASERRLAANLSQLVALTSTGARCLQQRMRLTDQQVQSIPHGNRQIPAQALPPLPPQGRLKLLYFGFIYRGKGIEDLFDALALLQAQRANLSDELELTIAGGTRPDMAFGLAGSYLDELKQRQQRTGLAGVRINWQLDVAEEQIPTLIQAHHVVVLPYQESEKLAWLGQMRGTSGVLSWAAACGRSVISSNARAFAEEVSHGNGAVYPQGNCPALAQELAYLLEHPTCLPIRSERAASLGGARNWSTVAGQFHAMFRQQVSKGKSAC